MATRAETAAKQQNMKELYDITRFISGKNRPTEKQIKNKKGYTLTTMEEQTNRWTEHFKELLNRPAPSARAE